MIVSRAEVALSNNAACLETGLVEMVENRWQNDQNMQKSPKSAHNVRLESKSLLQSAWWPGIEFWSSVGDLYGCSVHLKILWVVRKLLLLGNSYFTVFLYACFGRSQNHEPCTGYSCHFVSSTIQVDISISQELAS